MLVCDVPGSDWEEAVEEFLRRRSQLSSSLGKSIQVRGGGGEGRGAGDAEPEAGGSWAYLGSPTSPWLEGSLGVGGCEWEPEAEFGEDVAQVDGGGPGRGGLGVGEGRGANGSRDPWEAWEKWLVAVGCGGGRGEEGGGVAAHRPGVCLGLRTC